ncbi:MAG: PAS domain S-box protein [Ardenticatenales bacterium]|nr:PAS domain S-box protein [Ardenticatenales bacterium]
MSLPEKDKKACRVESRPAERDLALVTRVMEAALSCREPQELLRTCCREMALAYDLPYATASLLRGDDPQSPITVSAFSHPVAGGQTRPPSPLFPIDPDLTPLAAADAAGDPRLAHLRDRLLEHHIVSLLIVPISVQGRVAGAIELLATERRDFRDQDLALAQSVAGAIGRSVERERELGDLQRYADSLVEATARRTFDLRTERDRTRSILQALGDAVVVTDVDGAIRYVNPAAVELTGYSADEMWGEDWNLWLSDRRPAGFLRQVERVVQTGDVWRVEVVLRRKDGALQHVEMTLAPLSDLYAPGQPIGLVSVQRDITHLKEAEELKDQFVSNVSHELRTPLSVITLLAGNLDTVYDQMDDAGRQALIRKIRQRARVLSALIGDLLDISRIDSGKASTEHQAVDLAQLAREEAEKQLPLAQSKNQTLRVMESEPLLVMGNEDQLRQIIRNLLNNAIKYTQDKGRITCECRRHESGTDADSTWSGLDDLGPWVALRVRDTGIGISREDLPHVFERFFRVSAEGSVPGTGLGLSIAQELVELHGGHLAVASSLNEGSEFTAFLSLVEEE